MQEKKEAFFWTFHKAKQYAKHYLESYMNGNGDGKQNRRIQQHQRMDKEELLAGNENAKRDGKTFCSSAL